MHHKNDRHNLPCWDKDECQGNSSCSFYFLTKPHLKCFKCEGQKWNLSDEEIEYYMTIDANLMKLSSPETEAKGNNLKLDRTGLFPQRGVIASLDHRSISKGVAEKYGVETLYDQYNKPYGLSCPAYDTNKNFMAQKIKRYDKGQKWLYKESLDKILMFGQHLFPSGGKFITITEGEEDAMAAYQMLKEASPAYDPCVVSLFNGASSAERECKKHWEFINSFENIILAFDGDETGRKAAERICKLFDYKPKVILFSECKKNEEGEYVWKDANDYLKGNRGKDFVNLWWRSERVTPKGVLTFNSLWNAMTEKDSDKIASWPWEGLNKKLHGLYEGRLVIIKAPPKIGKCFGKDTLVRMFDGTVKAVQDIQTGDYLMGDDGTYRTVLSTVTGREKMYAVHQTKRDTYTVNESHILCVKNTDTKEKIDINLKDYLLKKDAIRWKGYSAPILRQQPFDLFGLTPYMLGVWLGDGDSNQPQITNTDNALNQLGILNHKKIPQGYLIAPMQDRQELLAGIIDTDGYFNGDTYVVTQKDIILATGIRDLARSLGHRASLKETVKYCYHKGEKREGVYYNVTINGALWTIPCKVKKKQAHVNLETARDSSVCGLVIEPLEEGVYYGFVLDGNHRFLLADFTVVHNTQLLREISFHVKETTKHNTGLIFLEDTKKSIGMGMCALYMNKPIQFPDIPVNLEELQIAHMEMSKDDRLMVFDPEDSRTVENIFSKITYFVKAHDCKVILLDHISMLAYQADAGDERRFLDKLVADLKNLTTSLNICIIAVTHVNDEGKTRGSRAAVQLCDALISLERDKLSDDPVIANTTEIIVEENRLTGDSGHACSLFFDRETGRMTELDPNLSIADGQGRTVQFDP